MRPFGAICCVPLVIGIIHMQKPIITRILSQVARPIKGVIDELYFDLQWTTRQPSEAKKSK